MEQAFAGLNLANLNVRAIAVDGTSGTILSVDETGRSVGLASMYNDVAETDGLSRIAAGAPETTAALGNTSPLARAMNMLGRIIHQADWIVGQLCGRFNVTDENNALKSGYDPVSRCWPAWINRAGFEVARFPQVVPVGQRIGEIISARATQFNLPPDVVIVSGTTDGCAAFLASGAKSIGDGVTSLGTTLTLKLLSATPVFSAEYGIYSHRIGAKWLAGGASNSGGKVLEQIFSKSELIELSLRVEPTKLTGLDYYPLPSVGERFPINDAKLQPRIGPRPADDVVYLQGLLEGISNIEALGYQRLAELGATPLKTIRSVGGGASNVNWTAIRKRNLGVPEAPVASAHAAMGAARLAWWGIDHAD